MDLVLNMKLPGANSGEEGPWADPEKETGGPDPAMELLDS